MWKLRKSELEAASQLILHDSFVHLMESHDKLSDHKNFGVAIILE